MKKSLSIIIAVVSIFTMTICMTGCGESSNLEAYMADNPDIQQQMEKTMSAMENSLLNVDVDYEENTEIVKCTLKETCDKDQIETLKGLFDEEYSALKTVMVETIEALSEATGFSGIKIRLVYLNGDDTEIWSKEYVGE